MFKTNLARKCIVNNLEFRIFFYIFWMQTKIFSLKMNEYLKI